MYIDILEKESYDNFSSYRQLKYISVTVPLLLIIVGSFGNIMVLAVLYSQARTISTYMYLISLAFMDQLVLLLSMTPKWLQHTFGIRLEIFSSMSCKTYLFLGTTFSQIAVWLIVVVTVERMIVVAKPLQAIQHTTVKRARVYIGTVIFLFFLVNFHFFFTIDLINRLNITEMFSNESEVVIAQRQYTVCDYKPHLAGFLLELWPHIDAMLYSYLPCVVITITNVVIIRYLRKAHQQRQMMLLNQKRAFAKHNSIIHSRPSFQSNHSSQQLLMLVLVSWVFLFTVIPISIFKMVMAIILNHYPRFLDDQERNCKFLLINAIVEILMNTNHSINFFLYCIAGKKFRKDFLKLFNRSRGKAMDRFSQMNSASFFGKSPCYNSMSMKMVNKTEIEPEDRKFSDTSMNNNNLEIVIGVYSEV